MSFLDPETRLAELLANEVGAAGPGGQPELRRAAAMGAVTGFPEGLGAPPPDPRLEDPEVALANRLNLIAGGLEAADELSTRVASPLANALASLQSTDPVGRFTQQFDPTLTVSQVLQDRGIAPIPAAIAGAGTEMVLDPLDRLAPLAPLMGLALPLGRAARGIERAEDLISVVTDPATTFRGAEGGQGFLQSLARLGDSVEGTPDLSIIRFGDDPSNMTTVQLSAVTDDIPPQVARALGRDPADPVGPLDTPIIEWSSLQTTAPVGNRGLMAGPGSRELMTMLDAADAQGIPIYTNPSPFSHTAMDVGELRAMYNNLGFETLEGTDLMIRRPLPTDPAERTAQAAARIDQGLQAQADLTRAGESFETALQDAVIDVHGLTGTELPSDLPPAQLMQGGEARELRRSIQDALEDATLVGKPSGTFPATQQLRDAPGSTTLFDENAAREALEALNLTPITIDNLIATQRRRLLLPRAGTPMSLSDADLTRMVDQLNELFTPPHVRGNPGLEGSGFDPRVTGERRSVPRTDSPGRRAGDIRPEGFPLFDLIGTPRVNGE